MSRAEQFIKDYTRNCSNELCYEEGLGNLYEPWLTPDQALRAVELAREEIKAEIERLIKSYSPIQSSEGKYRIEAYKEVLDIINSNCLNISRSGNSRIEAIKEALRMEYEKGRADVLRCIDPDVMVADFCSQPLSKTRSLASIYRQGIIDIIKRINRNEETSITSTRSIDDGGVHRA